MASVGGLEPWDNDPHSVYAARRMLDRDPDTPPRNSPVGGSRSSPSLGRSGGKGRRRGGSAAARGGLPGVGSPLPEEVGTPAFAMLQAQTAVSQVRSLARLSVEKNNDVVAFGKEMNAELRQLRKRMERERKEAERHETLEDRIARAAGHVDDMRDELSDLGLLRIKKEQELVELGDELRTNRVTIAGMSTSVTDNPAQRRLGVVTAKYDQVESDRDQLEAYRPTLEGLERRARRNRAAAENEIEQLQAVMADAKGEIESMRETLRLLQAVHISTTRDRKQYMQTLVADKLSHVEQLKMRQAMISMERQIENDNKERQDARIKELNRPAELEKQKNLAALAASGFEKKRMHKARLEAESREAVLAAAMRRIETETGVSSAEEFVARWERHATLNEQQQSIAVAKKHRQQDLQAEQVRSPRHLILRTLHSLDLSCNKRRRVGPQERLAEELEELTLAEAGTSADEKDNDMSARPNKKAELVEFEHNSSLLNASTQRAADLSREASDTTRLVILVRETLLGMLLRVCPRESRSTRWAAEKWDLDPLGVVQEVSMVVHAMGTEVFDGAMPTAEQVQEKVGRDTEWQHVIVENMQSVEFRKYNTRVRPLAQGQRENGRDRVLSEKASHAPAVSDQADMRTHLGAAGYKARDILGKARRVGMIGERERKDPYGMRKKKKKKRKPEAVDGEAGDQEGQEPAAGQWDGEADGGPAGAYPEQGEEEPVGDDSDGEEEDDDDEDAELEFGTDYEV